VTKSCRSFMHEMKFALGAGSFRSRLLPWQPGALAGRGCVATALVTHWPPSAANDSS